MCTRFRISLLALICMAAPLCAVSATEAPDALISKCVIDGHATASCFGSNETDATEILQAALSSNASSLLIDDIGRPWIVRPLFLSKVTDMVIEFQPRVHILARQDWFHGSQDSLLQISQAKNLTINGNGALLQMRRDDYAQPPRGTCPTCRNYTKAEWRCGIWLQQSDGVTLRGLTVIESGGDGIMILGGSLGRAEPIPSLNTYIVDCVFDRNCATVPATLCPSREFNACLPCCWLGTTQSCRPARNERNLSRQPYCREHNFLEYSWHRTCCWSRFGAGLSSRSHDQHHFQRLCLRWKRGGWIPYDSASL